MYIYKNNAVSSLLEVSARRSLDLLLPSLHFQFAQFVTERRLLQFVAHFETRLATTTTLLDATDTTADAAHQEQEDQSAHQYLSHIY
jgi:hypothetical protein